MYAGELNFYVTLGLVILSNEDCEQFVPWVSYQSGRRENQGTRLDCELVNTNKLLWIKKKQSKEKQTY